MYRSSYLINKCVFVEKTSTPSHNQIASLSLSDETNKNALQPGNSLVKKLISFAPVVDCFPSL